MFDVPVPAAERHCRKFGSDNLPKLGEGKPSSVTDHVQGYFRKRIFDARHYRVVRLIAASEVVLADGTPMPVRDDRKKPYIWTFVARTLVEYRFSTTTAATHPKQSLVVRRARSSLTCTPATTPSLALTVDSALVALSHARRKFFVWLAKQKAQHPPKRVMGNAINYTLKNWHALTRFITTPRSPDNNRSERVLRVIALGRKNFLFPATRTPATISPPFTPSSLPASQTTSIR